VELFIYFLVILNPFSQVLVLWDLMKEYDWKTFASIYGKATLLSYLVFVLFAVTGEMLFVKVFLVRLDSFRIFGGLIILYISFRYITSGPGSNMLFKGNISDLAPQISLPFIVGPATLWISILIGKAYSIPIGLAGLAAVMLINFLGVVVVHVFINELEGYKETLVGKYFSILMRINALFIGAIGVEMILTGIEGAIHSGELVQQTQEVVSKSGLAL
jgi:multiple antibiotic resistance protein